ncbi:unnamed protein product [Camellia sinensis]
MQALIPHTSSSTTETQRLNNQSCHSRSSSLRGLKPLKSSLRLSRTASLLLTPKLSPRFKPSRRALEEVEKNFATMRVMLCGDGEVEPNMDQVSQLTLEIYKEDVLALFIHKLPILGCKKRSGSLLVHIVETKGRLHLLLCAISREPFRITRLSCCE